MITCVKVLEDGTEEKSTTGSIFVSSAILTIFNLCPLLFLYMMCKYRGRLDDAEIRQKIGTLYNGLNPKKANAATYSMTFLIRRSVFVAITFLLTDQPGIQIQLSIYLTLLYIIYVGYAEFFETSGGKRLEIVNECLFVTIQYNFVLLHNLVWEQEAREQIGNSIIGMTSLLIGINLLVILVVSYRGFCRKLYLRKLRRQAIEEHRENMERRKQQEIMK